MNELAELKKQIEVADLTAEQRVELGLWLMGKGIGQAWNKALEEGAGEESADE